ncbi:MAG TPA: RsmE family RNA methyltransferase, partial [Bryobacteraceae bacterium]|nr:RsmE family RNA methyltransferase [Bryobacteraceae bacterium]
MARRRFFVDRIEDGGAVLRGDEAGHLARVLRAEPGQRYELSDNHALYLAEIREVSKDRVVFGVVEPLPSPEPPVRLHLYAALIKFDRFEWLVEKATELGVAAILPVEAARSEKGLLEASRKRAERWRKIARESSQQSRRLRLPEIHPAERLAGCVASAAGLRYYLEEEPGSPPLLSALPPPPARTAPADVALLIGPEGG